jgi:putative Mg2+ transporter-C (MgtC) family protein
MDAVWTTEAAPLLAMAFLFGALIGFEREWFSHSCGIRPCVLVCLGSAAFGYIVTELVPQSNWGNAFGAVATGVGFLGAGAILKQDRRRAVHGLSTAATIWTVAIIGLIVGVGQVTTGFVLFVCVLGVNLLLRPIAVWVARRTPHNRTPDDMMDS